MVDLSKIKSTQAMNCQLHTKQIGEEKVAHLFVDFDTSTIGQRQKEQLQQGQILLSLDKTQLSLLVKGIADHEDYISAKNRARIEKIRADLDSLISQ